MSEYDAHKQLLIECEEINKKKGFKEKAKFLVDKSPERGDTDTQKLGDTLGDPNDPSTWQLLD